MGKKGSWFSIVRKALSPDPKEKKEKKPQKSKRRWFGKQKSVDEEFLPALAVLESTSAPPSEDVKLKEADDHEQTKRANSVVSAAEAAVAVANAAAAEVVRFLHAARYHGKSTEEIAAIKIQAVCRGFLARRASRALRGLMRLRSLIRGKAVQRQATTTLRCMQTLARVQSQIRARRIRLQEENQALQRQIEQKREKDIEKLRVSMGENWENSAQSMEKVKANLQYKQEAAMRRERAMAYAYSQQQAWKNSSKTTNPTLMDPNNPQWGWSWLERWMAARPWESRTAPDKDLNISDCMSVKSTLSRTTSLEREPSRVNSRRDLKLLDSKSPQSSPKSGRPPTRHSISSPCSSPRSSPRSINSPTSPSAVAQPRPRSRRSISCGGDGDLRSPLSVMSERSRRHSITESLASDDENFTTPPTSPSHTSNTPLANSRTTRMPSPLGKKTIGHGPEKPSGSGSPAPPLAGGGIQLTRKREFKLGGEMMLDEGSNG